MNIFNVRSSEVNREILTENNRFKSIYFKFDEGKGLPNHSHNGFATIQVISGKVSIEFKNGEKFELRDGDFLPFDARIEHNIIAKELSKVLVTIEKTPVIKKLSK
ncbi:MAG: cupin domain-containing protein [Clostridium perfringens]|nr:cupin domain-containing protein [Clostridium perfringens]